MITELLDLHDKALEDLERAQKDYARARDTPRYNDHALKAAMDTVENRRNYANGIYDSLQIVSKHTVLVE